MSRKIVVMLVCTLVFASVFSMGTAFAMPVSVTINSGTNGTAFDITTYGGYTIYIATDELVELTGTADVRIEPLGGMAGINIELIDINISSSGAPITFSGVGNKLKITGTNILSAGINDDAVCVPGSAGLIIDGTGKLTATGGAGNDYLSLEGGCGIGGANSDVNTITINGGTIIAEGGYCCAGIGGGELGGTNIVINDGNVTASGGYDAAAIGSGSYGLLHCYIQINGGRVETIPTADDGSEAGIGTGYGMDQSGEITITGGLIIARGGYETGWNEYAPGIGGGTNCTFGNINISGGQIYAIAANGMAEDIGASYSGSCAGVNITNPGSAAVFLLGDNVLNRTPISAGLHTYVNSENVASNSAYGFDEFPNEFNGRLGYGYLKNAVVTFNYQDGTTLPAYQHYWCGNLITEPADPVRLGYAFNGWHTDTAGVNPYLFDAVPVLANTLLYAHWVEQGTHSGEIKGNFADSAGDAIEGAYMTLQSRPIDVTTSSTGDYSFGSVFYTNHTLIVKDANGSELRRYALSMTEGTTPRATVDDTLGIIAIEYVGNTASVTIPLRYDGANVNVNGQVLLTQSAVSNRAINPSTGD